MARGGEGMRDPGAWDLWGGGVPRKGGRMLEGLWGRGVQVLTGPSLLPGSYALEAQTGPQRRVPHPRTRSGSRPRPNPRSRSRPGTSGGCRRPARRARG